MYMFIHPPPYYCMCRVRAIDEYYFEYWVWPPFQATIVQNKWQPIFDSLEKYQEVLLLLWHVLMFIIAVDKQNSNFCFVMTETEMESNTEMIEVFKMKMQHDY